MAGQLLTLGIPSLNKLYEDEDGIVISHFYGNKYVIHSEIKTDTPDLSFLKKAKEVNQQIKKAFNKLGVTTLYTWSEDETQENYNKFLGYERLNDTEFYAPNYDKPLKEWVMK